jgi:hypothetical protein
MNLLTQSELNWLAVIASKDQFYEGTLLKSMVIDYLACFKITQFSLIKLIET